MHSSTRRPFLLLFAVTWLTFPWTSILAAQPQSDTGVSVFRLVSPSVVTVHVASDTGRRQGSAIAYHYGMNRGKRESTWFVTNAHVVSGAEKLEVVDAGRRYTAQVQYIDEPKDLALILVQGFLPDIVSIRGAADILPGTKVYSVGSPLNLEKSIAEGIVSAVRNRDGVTLIQSTAPISAGSSGGGLFNDAGELIGVTTFKLKAGEGLNFSVDARNVERLDSAVRAALIIRGGYQAAVIEIGSQFYYDVKYSETPALVKWLAESQSPDGSPLSDFVIRRFRETASSDKVFWPGHPEFDALLLTFFQQRPNRDRAHATASTTVHPDDVRIVCPMIANSDNSYQFDLNITLNLTKRTVDNRPALFTDTEVNFKTGKDLAFTATLDRYSLRVQIGNQERPRLLNGTCKRLTERKL